MQSRARRQKPQKHTHPHTHLHFAALEQTAWGAVNEHVGGVGWRSVTQRARGETCIPPQPPPVHLPTIQIDSMIYFFISIQFEARYPSYLGTKLGEDINRTCLQKYVQVLIRVPEREDRQVCLWFFLGGGGVLAAEDERVSRRGQAGCQGSPHSHSHTN